MSFEAKDYPISDILNKSVFYIPRNQRRYVWKKVNWQELLDDILFSTRNKSTHFLGSIVLKDDGKKQGLSYYTIIDGQQRLTTITIVLLAIMKLFKENNMDDEFLGTVSYLQSKNNRNRDIIIINSDYYISIANLIQEMINLTDCSISISAFVDSRILSKTKDKIIGEALKHFYFEIKKEIESLETLEEQKSYLLRIRDATIDMILVKIVSSSEEDSYTIFEILNARGQALEDHELLKNYIMRYIQPEKKRDIAKFKWEEMENNLGPSMQQFIRHYTTHKYGNSKENKDSAYRRIQKATKGISKGTKFEELLNDIKLKSEYYIKFIKPIANENCSQLEYNTFTFFKSKRFVQFRPVLLSLIHQKEKHKISEEEYEESLKYIYNFFVCYNIIGEERSNKLEDIAYNHAQILENKYSDKVLYDFADSLKKMIPNYEWFANAFKNLGWSNHFDFYSGEKTKKRVKVTLEIIEKFVSNRSIIDDFTIEHMLPGSENIENAQIGNLVPLEESLNMRCGKKTLDEKFAIFEESNFRTARNVSQRYKNELFNPAQRTEYLARLIYNNILQLNQIKYS